MPNFFRFDAMDKDKAAICLELYKAQTERFKDTRRIQWKINLAFWTFIIVSSSFLYGKYQISYCVGIIASVFFTAIHFLWCLCIQISLEHDKNIANAYRAKLDAYINGKEVIPDTRKFRFRWLFLQVAMTIAFISSSMYFLGKDLPAAKIEPNNQIQLMQKNDSPN